VGKKLNAKYIHKEMFSVCGEKCSTLEVVHNLVEKRGRRFADEEEVEVEVYKWLRQQSKYFYAVGFDALVKRWDRCWSMICREINGIPRFEYHMF
jgi:glutathionylspermidine synthase